MSNRIKGKAEIAAENAALVKCAELAKEILRLIAKGSLYCEDIAWHGSEIARVIDTCQDGVYEEEAADVE